MADKDLKFTQENSLGRFDELTLTPLANQYLAFDANKTPVSTPLPLTERVAKKFVVANSFAVGDVIKADSEGFSLAQADAPANFNRTIGVVESASSTQFTLVEFGFISGLSGLTAGAAYYLSNTLAGKLTGTAPTYAKMMLVALSSSTAVVLNHPSVSNTSGANTAVVPIANSFVLGDLLYLNGSTYTKARADVPSTSEVIGMVLSSDGSSFTLLLFGVVSGLSGLTAGSVYFLSATTAGAMTTVEPSTVGQVSKPVFIAMSTTSGLFINMRGLVIPSSGGGGGATTTTSDALMFLGN